MRTAISEISCTLPHPSLISNIYHKRRDQVKYVRIMVWRHLTRVWRLVFRDSRASKIRDRAWKSLFSRIVIINNSLLSCFARVLLFRCCLLEPGTVLTPFSAKAQEWSRVSTPNADPKTLNLKSTFSAKIQKEIEGKSQSSEECAQFVKEIILDEKGNLRYQTNEKFGFKEVAAKLAEPSGNSSVDIITTRYFGEIKQER